MNFTVLAAPVEPRLQQFYKVMKLTTLLLIIALVQASAKSYSQKISLSETNAPLTKVLSDIKSQSGFTFLYTDQNVTDQKVTVKISNANIEEALNACFKNSNVEYKIVDKNVLLKLKEQNVTDQTKAIFAQITVTGKVIDETGQPLAGVTVKIKDTQLATSTDKNGAYTISVPDDKTILVFSFIGYETQELVAKNIATGSALVLKASTTNLKEVVVNKGYYSTTQELNTGNVSKVTAKEIGKQPVGDPMLALIARVPGLNIQQNSGIPGSNPQVRLRGQNSIANGNDPLYILDGVPFNSTTLSLFGGSPLGYPLAIQGNKNNLAGGLSPFSVLNPGDIESIEILKDADATAIYGSRGANGVILITTKKGKPGRTTVDINVSQGIGKVAHHLDMLNTQQYLQLRREGYQNDGAVFKPHDFNHDINGDWDTTRYTDWQKVLIGNTAHVTDMQGSLSGGNTNTQFVISGNYNKQTTVFPGDAAFTKGSGRFSLSHTSENQKFHSNISVSYNVANNVLPTIDLANKIILAPNAPALYDASGNLNLPVYNGSVTFDNPLRAFQSPASQKTNGIFSNLNVNYLIAKGLQLNSNIGYSRTEMTQTLYAFGTYYPLALRTPSVRSNITGNNVLNSWILEPQLTYQKEIGKGNLQVLIGTSFQENNQSSIQQTASGFSSDALVPDLLLATSYQISSVGYSQYRYNAVYGRVNYDYQDKYVLNVTARRDGSSRFGPGNQWGNFGSVGAAWIFYKEKWLANSDILSFGKLRGSYGITGNDQTGDYKYLSTYSGYTPNYFGSSALAPTLLANPNFGWEQVRKLEGTIDLGFLRDKLNLSLSYYHNLTTNQLVGYPLPSITGFNNIPGYNLPATIENNGLEIELSTVNIQSRNFTWSSHFNITVPKNTLLSYPGIENSTYNDTYTVGQSLFTKRGYLYTGINPQTGTYTFADLNNDGKLTTADYVAGPSITQKYYGGLSNSFKYKHFELDVFIQFVKQLAPSYINYLPNAPGYNNSNWPTAIVNRWKNPGDIASVERATVFILPDPSTALSNYKTSNGVIVDASFIRLKNLAASYSLPDAWQRKLALRNARVYVQAQNLFTITNYVGLDPETPGLGLPPLRMINLGIQASF